MSSDKPARRHYNAEDVEGALQCLALSMGNTRAVERETGVPQETVRYWRDRSHADRYRQIREDVIPKMQRDLAARHEDMARQTLDKAEEALEQLDTTSLRGADLAQAVRNLSVTSAVHTDKALVMRGQPNQITENRSLPELGDAIFRKVNEIRLSRGAEPIDVEHEEIEEAQEVTAPQ